MAEYNFSNMGSGDAFSLCSCLVGVSSGVGRNELNKSERLHSSSVDAASGMVGIQARGSVLLTTCSTLRPLQEYNCLQTWDLQLAEPHNFGKEG